MPKFPKEITGDIIDLSPYITIEEIMFLMIQHEYLTVAGDISFEEWSAIILEQKMIGVIKQYGLTNVNLCSSELSKACDKFTRIVDWAIKFYNSYTPIGPKLIPLKNNYKLVSPPVIQGTNLIVNMVLTNETFT